MGFKDAGWAYTLDLPMMQKVVLAALCLATDDKTHQTFIGQERLAEMVGSSPVSVRRALGVLDGLGVISRQRRSGAGGFRTSDLITVNVATYRSESPQGSEPTGLSANKAESPRLPITEITPTDQSDRAEEIIQMDHPDDQPETPPTPSIADRFDEAYAHWPKKEKRKDAFERFVRAARARGIDHLVADIIRFGDAYAAHVPRQFVPALGVWINAERWDDDLPQPREIRTQDRAPTRNERNLALVADIARQTASTQRGISA